MEFIDEVHVKIQLFPCGRDLRKRMKFFSFMTDTGWMG